MAGGGGGATALVLAGAAGGTAGFVPADGGPASLSSSKGLWAKAMAGVRKRLARTLDNDSNRIAILAF